jgi:hypothetical protein
VGLIAQEVQKIQPNVVWRNQQGYLMVNYHRVGDVTTWIALIILALGVMLLILNESGVIAGLDTATFSYVAIFSAIIVYLSGGMVGSYRERRSALLRDVMIWLALGFGVAMLYIFAQGRGLF